MAEGACDASYGIHVAEIAKFPTSVIKLAKRKAEIFEDFGDGTETTERVSEAETAAGVDLVSSIVRSWAAKRAKLASEGGADENENDMAVDGAKSGSSSDLLATWASLKAEMEKHRSELEGNAWVSKVLCQ